MVKNDKLRWFLVVSTFFCSFLITTSARSQTVDYAITVGGLLPDETISIGGLLPDETWKIVGSCASGAATNHKTISIGGLLPDKTIAITDFMPDKTICITNVDSLSRETLIKLKLVDE